MVVRAFARWIVPVVTPPFRDGWVDVDVSRGEIVGIGARGATDAAETSTAGAIDLGGAVILPGLVNAHTHLELSHLAGRVPPAEHFVTWVRAMLAVRFGQPATVGAVVEAVVQAIADMNGTGTVAVGDIGNTDAAVRPLAASPLSGVHFKEALGFRGADAHQISSQARREALVSMRVLSEERRHGIAVSVAPHAPYSTSPALIQELVRGLPVGSVLDTPVPASPVSSIHLAESHEELEFLMHGTGPFRALLADLGAWDEAWTPPRAGPVAYVQQLGALHRDLLVVHGTQLTRRELDVLTEVGSTLVLCVRSNAWVGAGVPPVADAVASGVRLAIGTDSLASVEDLNLFAELAALRRVAPEVPASTILRAATWGGAEALGCRCLGYLGPGASSRALVRTPPDSVTDVEEWLVAQAGDTTDLRWLDRLVGAKA